MVVIFVLCCALILAIFYYLSRRKYNYWKKRHVPYLKPLPIFGNYKDYIVLKNTITAVVNSICDKFPTEPYIGAFYGTEPCIIIRDPDYLKLILTKDFYYFNSREVADYTNREVTTGNLFFTSGDRWKILRQNLTPIFSSAKMKKMFYLIEECNNALDKLTDEAVKAPVTEVRSMMGRYTIDCIGSCAFGINMRAMSSESEVNPFRDIGHKIFDPSTIRGLKLIGRAVWPRLFYNLGFEAFPSEIIAFFGNLLTNVFEQRQYKHSGRHDFVDLVLGFKENKYITGDSISNLKGDAKKIVLEVDNELLFSQCTVIFAAGFETSATTLSYLLFELAKNPEKQKRAIEEVDMYFRQHQKLVYECIFETPYLTACLDETLRLYPVLGVLTREVVEDYTLPSGVPLTKGVRVHIPIYHLHHNPKYFPEPEVFRPERFLGSEKESIAPFTYLPFGEGPRICIGLRFAKMQIIAALLTILKKCRIELHENTPLKLEFDSRVLTTQPITGINLKFIARDSTFTEAM